jgi:hypothetical protein
LKDLDGDDLPPTTVPAAASVTVKGFDNADAATSLGQTVAGVVSTVGSFIDLSRLDGVTVAVDYDAALAELDRGMDGLRPLSRSNSEEMQGVAMSPAVMRNGEVRTHLVFAADMLVPLIVDEDLVEPDARSVAIGIIAHECAHVQVTAEKGRAIPEARLGTRIEGYERAVMFQLAEICWDEYAACRLSAPFARTQVQTHAATLTACLETAREQADAAIRSYRLHGDLNVLVGEAGSALCGPMKAAAYLLGGMDAEGLDWADLDEVRSSLVAAGYDELVDRLHDELARLWATREKWEPTLQVFAGLEDVAREVFRSGGVFFRTAGDGGCHIDVPYSARTMPGV